jgi:septum formation protein
MIAESLASISPIVLASRSPQRRAILAQLGAEFAVVEPDYVEDDPAGASPQELVVAHARGKARSVAGRTVLGVDTTVAIDGRSLAKPADEHEAGEWLRLLSGRRHTVHSGLCLRVGGREEVRLASTDVRFRVLDDRDVDWYVGTGEWRERAGGYAVQGVGAALVERIEGDYTNVVGLPVAALLDAVARAASPGD